MVPPVLREAAFAGIGLQVGLRFTMSTVREVGALLGRSSLCIVGLMVACFGLAVVLDLTTSATLLDAYLATTPGGLYAVLAAAFGSGADTTFVLAGADAAGARHGAARAARSCACSCGRALTLRLTRRCPGPWS